MASSPTIIFSHNYGGPTTLSAAYDPSRGQGSFGILAYGSCGYTNSDGSLPFPRDTYAAAADANADYPGSCGRCYDIRCQDGEVYETANNPVQIIDGYFDGDYRRPYLAAINPNVTDTKGRAWPGNPEESKGLLFVKCWDPTKVLRVRIGDSCPCNQVLPSGAPGVKPGGEVRRQDWCCGGEHHFDLSYYAFEQLAHPVFGVMMLQFRPVDCTSGAELQFTPGFVSKTIFRDVPQPGWGYFPDKAQAQVSVPGIAPDGSGATCATVSPQGDISFRCRDCYKPGYQPFAGASGVEFWIKPNSGSSDPFVSSTPTGQIPGLKMFVLNEETKQYCGSEPVLGKDVHATEMSGNWFRVVVPFSLFKCGNGLVAQDQLDNIAFQNIAERNAIFCLADFKILGTGEVPAGALVPAVTMPNITANGAAKMAGNKTDDPPRRDDKLIQTSSPAPSPAPKDNNEGSLVPPPKLVPKPVENSPQSPMPSVPSPMPGSPSPAQPQQPEMSKVKQPPASQSPAQPQQQPETSKGGQPPTTQFPPQPQQVETNKGGQPPASPSTAQPQQQPETNKGGQPPASQLPAQPRQQPETSKGGQPPTTQFPAQPQQVETNKGGQPPASPSPAQPQQQPDLSKGVQPPASPSRAQPQQQPDMSKGVQSPARPSRAQPQQQPDMSKGGQPPASPSPAQPQQQPDMSKGGQPAGIRLNLQQQDRSQGLQQPPSQPQGQPLLLEQHLAQNTGAQQALRMNDYGIEEAVDNLLNQEFDSIAG